MFTDGIRLHIRILKNILINHSETAHFIICSSIFCLIDYLGSVVYGGKNLHSNAIKYIQNNFPNSYILYADLLYHMYRHGTVHKLTPKSFRLDSDSLTWSLTSHDAPDNRKEHLKVFQCDYDSYQYVIVVNLPQLLDDLESSLDKIARNINHTLKSEILYKNSKEAIGFLEALKHKDRRFIDNKGCTHR